MPSCLRSPGMRCIRTSKGLSVNRTLSLSGEGVSFIRGDSNNQIRQSGGLSGAAALAGASSVSPEAERKRIPSWVPNRTPLENERGPSFYCRGPS